jgi:hypothetical protein
MSKETTQPKETTEVKAEQPKVENKPVSEAKPAAAPKEEPKLSNEERVVKFLKEKGNGEFILLNDFLKSLYPVPKMGMKPAWLDRVESKKLKGLLTSLVASGQVEIEANRHSTLGGFYYDTQDPNQVTQYHNIATVQMRARSCQ